MRWLVLLGVGGLTACEPLQPIGPICLPIGTCEQPGQLYFFGAQAGDYFDWFHTPPMLGTARGGVQTFHIDGLNGRAFDAVVDGDAFTATPFGADTVQITGVAVGDSTLRIVDPDTRAVYGAITLGIDEVIGAHLSVGTMSFGSGTSPTYLWGGGGLYAVYALDGVNGRLVDETMQLALPPGATPHAASRWDMSYLPDPLPSPFRLNATLTDGTPVLAIAETAPDVDQLKWVPLFETTRPTTIAVGSGDTYPFEASLGGVPIEGATPNAAATGGLEVDPAPGMWVSFRAVSVGPGHLTVSLGSARLDFDVDVIAAN
jgi:hypothetical protein